MLKSGESPITVAARALRSARLVVATTGAGMSQESGIPTFRDARVGLWARYDPEELATETAFQRHPARVFGWYAWRRRRVRAAVPHAGYVALVALETRVPEVAIVTQNVDGLHRRAMLVVGTSGLVQPAADLPLIARDAGATVIEVNPVPTAISTAAHVVCRGPAGTVLPALVAALTREART